MTAAQAWKWVAEKRATVWSNGDKWSCSVYGKLIGRRYPAIQYFHADTPLAAVIAAAKAMEAKDGR